MTLLWYLICSEFPSETKSCGVTSDTVEHWVESVPTKDIPVLPASTNAASSFLEKKHWSFFWPANSEDVTILAILGKCILLWACNVLMLAPPPCPLWCGLILTLISAEQQIFCCLLADDATAISCKHEKIIVASQLDVIFLNRTKRFLSSDAWNKCKHFRQGKKKA